MSVLNVLNTNNIAGGASVYLKVNTGIYRIIPTSGITSIQFNSGPVITLLQDETILLQGGKPGRAGITLATDSATAVYTLGEGGTGHGNTHPFSVGDYIAVIDSATAIPSAFESAASAGKVITAITGNTVTTDIDSSAATADYVYAGGSQAHVHRCVKITAGTNALTVEEVQIVGG